MEISDITELYAYNSWANERILKASAKLTSEAFLRPMGNSFSSVRDTLAHILAAEWIWLERWQGRYPKTMLDPADFPNVNSLQSRSEAVAGNYRNFLHEVTVQQVRHELAYINREGKRHSYPLWQQMAHVVNHSSYHRGQVTTLLRQLGAEPIDTDFLTYYDEVAHK